MSKPARAPALRARPIVAVPEDLRRHNRGIILDLLARHGELSRTAIAASTALTGAAVSRISRELLDAGLVIETEAAEKRVGRGRPAIGLALAADGGFVVGIGIGAYEQWIQIANLRGACVARSALQLLGRTPARAINDLALGIRRLAADAKMPPRRLLGVGVAVAGIVDPERAEVLSSPNIGWKDVPLGAQLVRTLGVPVVVEAMHHALNLAEARQGAARGVSDAVLVNVSMGIGSSVMAQGHIVRGSHGAAGQIGHLRVAGATELCTCGRRGCLDTVASGHAVLRQLGLARERRAPKEHDATDARRLAEACERERRGERAARVAFRSCGERLGEALAALRAVVDPDRILLAGPLAQAGSYVEGVRARLDPAPREAPSGEPLLFLATHVADAAAASLALARLVYAPALDLERLRP